MTISKCGLRKSKNLHRLSKRSRTLNRGSRKKPLISANSKIFLMYKDPKGDDCLQLRIIKISQFLQANWYYIQSKKNLLTNVKLKKTKIIHEKMNDT